MSHNIILGRYYPERSKIHAMNPIAKLLCIVIFILTAFISTTWQLNLLLIVFTFIFLMLTNIPLMNYLRTTKIMIPFYIIMLFIGILFSVPLLDSFLLMVRITLIIFYITMLTSTTPMTEIIYGLEKILFFLNIFGLNVSKISLSIAEAIRLIPNMIDEKERILKSAASRGLDYRHSNILIKYKILKSMIAPIFTLTVKKSEELKFSMALRFYYSKKRTNFRMNRLGVFDTYMVMIYLLILLIIIKKEIIG